MARPIEFDKQRALVNAMQLFWRQGYTATSLPQLLQTMGIGRSSFYAAFGDKRSLFIESLELFGDRTANILVDISEREDPINAVRCFFESTLFDAPADRMRCGCMMVNTILELADVDEELSQLATQKLDRIQHLFASCFADAIENGKLNSLHSPDQIARFVMTLNQGLRVASRKNLSTHELGDIVDTSIKMLQAAVH